MCLPDGKDLITPHPSPRRHLPLKLRRGRQKAKPLLRIAILTAQVDATNGTDTSVPYKVRPKTKHCTTGSRCSYGLFQCPEPGDRQTQQRTNVARNATVSTIISIPGHRNNRIRRCANAPLKKPTREC